MLKKSISLIAVIAWSVVATSMAAQDAPVMKMTTEIPDGITTPDNIETQLGELTFFDGVPDEAAAEQIYNLLDFTHAYQAYWDGIKIASMDAMRRGLLEFGPANTTVLQFADLMDSKALFLTPNTTSVYQTAFPGGAYTFVLDGVTLQDIRTAFHFYATGITPAMALKKVGKGSQYAITYRDAAGRALDGSKTYKVNVPANPPARDFWSFTLYDNQTRSMLQTDARFPAIGSNDAGLAQNDDGSFDIYFGPEAPAGKESNWVQTVPGKGWNVILRLYGPLEPWFDQSWRPGEIELVE